MSFYDDASLILLANGEAGKGTNDNGKVYTLKPLEVLDDTITVNGGFETAGTPGDDNYSLGITSPPANRSTNASVVIANGVLTISNGDDGASSDARAYITDGTTTNSIETNEEYRVEYTVVENNGVTGFNIYHQGGQFIAAPRTVGTHVVYTKNTTNQLILFQNTTANSSIVLDDLTVRKVTTQPSDFTMNRGTDLSATVIGKDGLVKKSRENLLVNTVFAGLTTDDRPTGYNTSTTIGAGTLGPLSSDSTKVKVEITNVSGGRYFLNGTSSITNTALCTSVFVDAVTGTAPEVRQVVRAFATGAGTRTVVHFALKDGEVVDETDAVEAGHRYAFVASYSTSSVHRFGIGTNQSFTALGTVTLSRPQIERGVRPTDYIKNSSTTATAVVGMKVDEPRFNYDIGGTTPHLLLEPQRVNFITYSEYFEGWSSTDNATLTSNNVTSPEGVQNATKLLATGSGTVNHQVNSPSFTVSGSAVTASIFAKKGNTNVVRLRLNGSSSQVRAWFDLQNGTTSVDANGTSTITAMSDGWYRCTVTESGNTNTSVSLQVFINKTLDQTSWPANGDEYIYIHGAQYEEGTEATSYIPSHGSATTRTADGLSNLTLPSAITDEDDYTFFVDETASLDMIGNRGPRLTHSDSAKDSNMGYYINSSNKKTFFCWSNGGSDDKPFSDVTSESTDTKYAFHVDNTNERVRCYVDGECIADAAITTDINADKITNSTGEGSLQKLNSILYFPEALSDVDCKVLTGRTNYTAFPEMADKLGYRTYE